MRRTGPKTRLARRAGEPLREKDVRFLQKRNYPPGMHGQGRRRLSEFGGQLLEKQKAKWIYGVSERQFRRYVEAASRKKEMTGVVLLEVLELRLDNVVYRLGFGSSRPQARQMVSHGFIAVNGRKVTVPSYKLNVGDAVSIQKGKQAQKLIIQMQARVKDKKPLEWLEVSASDLSGKVLSRPTADNTGSTLRMPLIIEYYSR